MEAYRYLAQVYDEMMQDTDYSAWAAYLHGFLQLTNAKNILDVACGTGGITRALYALNYRITASDISANMLKIAKEKIRDAGQDIRFVRQDLRSIQTGNKANAVICACDGPNYIDTEGLTGFFSSSYTALVPGGLLLFDISTSHKLKNIMNGEVFFDDTEDATVIWQNTFDDSNNALRMDVTLFLRSGDVFERFDETHEQYAHDTDEVKAALYKAGFKKVSVYDCFSENPPVPESSRIQFVCEKPKPECLLHK